MCALRKMTHRDAITELRRNRCMIKNDIVLYGYTHPPPIKKRERQEEEAKNKNIGRVTHFFPDCHPKGTLNHPEARVG